MAPAHSKIAVLAMAGMMSYSALKWAVGKVSAPIQTVGTIKSVAEVEEVQSEVAAVALAAPKLPAHILACGYVLTAPVTAPRWKSTRTTARMSDLKAAQHLVKKRTSVSPSPSRSAVMTAPSPSPARETPVKRQATPTATTPVRSSPARQLSMSLPQASPAAVPKTSTPARKALGTIQAAPQESPVRRRLIAKEGFAMVGQHLNKIASPSPAKKIQASPKLPSAPVGINDENAAPPRAVEPSLGEVLKVERSLGDIMEAPKSNRKRVLEPQQITTPVKRATVIVPKPVPVSPAPVAAAVTPAKPATVMTPKKAAPAAVDTPSKSEAGARLDVFQALTPSKQTPTKSWAEARSPVQHPWTPERVQTPIPIAY